MKKMKKIMALVVAMIMTLAMATTALAEGENTTYKLTITDTKAGHTYSVYQIFTGDISGTSPNYVLANVKYGQNYIPEGKNQGDLVPENELKAIIDADHFAQNLSTAGDAFKTVTSFDGNTEIIGLPAGYYLVKDTTEGLTGQDAKTKFILQVVGNTTVKVKSAVPSSEKKVKENVKTVTGSTDTRIPDYTIPAQYNDVADYNIGDDVPFQLIGTLPSNYDDYTTYTYIFHDKMDAGLTFKEDTLTVTVGSTTLSKGIDYTVVTTGLEDKCTFEIRFTNTKQIAAITKDSKIIVDFKATLNSNAVIGLPGNVNESYIEFSNNPNQGGGGETGTTPGDKVIVFTYKLDVTKVDGAAKGEDGTYTTKLKDAEFVLLNSDKSKVAKIDGGKFAGWVEDSSIEKNTDGTYPVDYTLKSDENGNFSITGLDDGIYYLKETKAPTGYNLLVNPVKVEIIATTANNQTWDGAADKALTALQIKVNDGDAASGNLSDGTVSTNIENNSGTTLPSTGGVGTTIFYVLGSILVIAAAVLLITKRRMQSVNK